jgi:hypothetical protein
MDSNGVAQASHTRKTGTAISMKFYQPGERVRIDIPYPLSSRFSAFSGEWKSAIEKYKDVKVTHIKKTQGDSYVSVLIDGVEIWVDQTWLAPLDRQGVLFDCF